VASPVASLAEVDGGHSACEASALTVRRLPKQCLVAGTIDIDRYHAGPWEKRAVTGRNRIASTQTHPMLIFKPCLRISRPLSLNAREGFDRTFANGGLRRLIGDALCKVRYHFALCKSNR
jgi:hypothetical protein